MPKDNQSDEESKVEHPTIEEGPFEQVNYEQKQQTNYGAQYPLSYHGNILWPILFLLLFPPVGLVLIGLNTCVRQNGVSYSLHYRGSEAWLIFWTVLFFPVAIILGFLNGFDIRGEKV